MRCVHHLLAILAVPLGLLAPSPAEAGGFGALLTGGARNDFVYFYDQSNNYAQFRQTQTSSNFGGGAEFVLGDRDDKISGLFRLYYLQDSPQKDPATLTQLVTPENVVAAWRTGVQWGIFGSPESWMVSAITAAGSGFVTRDHTEYLMLQAGVGGTWRFTRNLQAYVDIDYTLRHRKGFTQGVNGYGGVRFLFD
jgi:hypothetical protein